MGTRAPNEFESKLHVAALGNAKKEITAKQCEAAIPDPNARAAALNFLLGAGMFKLLKDAKGNVLFRAVSKGELTATKDLTAEETLVLSHIQAAHTDGIWKKHLRSKTNLHATIIDRCIKTLMKKQLIKHVHSVQHPNLKMYMLEHLEPSVALTGGPWYTDNELDTEFIKLLSTACLRFIQDNSLPKQRSRDESERLIYALSNPPQYPTAQNVQAFLKKSRITETELSVEHVEMLLNVLVLDGEIEKLPAFGMTLWNSSMNDAGDESDASESDNGSKRKRKRKHAEENSDAEAHSSNYKKTKTKINDSDIDSDAKSTKSSKSKRSNRTEDGGSDDEDRRKRRKKSKASSDEEIDEDRGRKSSKSKQKRRHRSSSSSSESDHRSKSRSKTKKVKKRDSSPADQNNNAYSDLLSSGAHVYRAIRQEKLSLGWAEAPCGDCPSFEFCSEKAPVNPRDCEYFGEWLSEGKAGDVKEKLSAAVKDW